MSEAPLGSALCIDSVDGSGSVRLRLAELGLRPGESVVVSHRTAGGGRVVSVDHSRIALDRATLRGIKVAPIDDPVTDALAGTRPVVHGIS